MICDERKIVMKKLLPLFSLVLVSLVLFSSCMKVHVSLPGDDVPVNAGTTQNAQPSEPMVTLPDAAVTLPEQTTLQEITTQPAATTQPETTAPAVKTPLEMTKAELLDWFNKSVNDVKEVMPSFDREKLTTVSDIKLSNQVANTLVDFVKGALLSEEVEKVSASKGSSCTEIMTPTGERYVSNLFIDDVKDITVSTQGTSYVVTVTMPDAKNPTKDESAYMKIFNFITVDDVVKTYAPKVGATVDRKNISVEYSGCYAKAVISPDGKVESYETYVICVMKLLDASVKKVVTINTDVEMTLVTTTKFANFSY